jgi:hypothetical protein
MGLIIPTRTVAELRRMLTNRPGRELVCKAIAAITGGAP